MTMPRGPLPYTREQAETVYLGMAPGERTLRAFQARLREEFGRAPRVGNLHRWIKEGGWQEKAKQQDAEVQAAVREEAKEQAVAEGVNRVMLLNGAIKNLAQETIEIVKAEPKTYLTNAADLVAVLGAIVDLSKQAMLEEGGPTERTEHTTRNAGEYDEIVEGYHKAMQDRAKKAKAEEALH